MIDESDYALTPEQWKALKALRAPAAYPSGISRFAVEDLITLGLVVRCADCLVMTSLGRKVLIRGSSQLLQDIAA